MTDVDNTSPPQPTKEEIVRDIAKAIADRRKARNLSIEKVFQTIKIRIPYLEAIEAGRWDQLPADVFIRSFIKRYADHLGLDGEKLLAPYFAFNKPQEKKAVTVPQILKGSEITSLQVIGMALAGIFVIVLIKLMTQDRPQDVMTPPTEALIAVSTAVATGLIAPTEGPLSPASHRLEVFSPNVLWLRVSTKEKTFEGFIPQNSTWTWKGDGVFSLRLGHTQQVTIVFDGQTIPIQDNQKKLDLPLPS